MEFLSDEWDDNWIDFIIPASHCLIFHIETTYVIKLGFYDGKTQPYCLCVITFKGNISIQAHNHVCQYQP